MKMAVLVRQKVKFISWKLPVGSIKIKTCFVFQIADMDTENEDVTTAGILIFWI
jgi:hypothetical protein|tara:strand:+ start:892 stop:1053 length:162 start_codon:yes stop_codon:yes gene_type:complete